MYVLDRSRDALKTWACILSTLLALFETLLFLYIKNNGEMYVGVVKIGESEPLLREDSLTEDSLCFPTIDQLNET